MTLNINKLKYLTAFPVEIIHRTKKYVELSFRK
jgi:hypothetical protein